MASKGRPWLHLRKAASRRPLSRCLRPLALLLAGAPLLAVTPAAYADENPLQPVTVTATGVSNMTAASTGDVSMQQIAGEPLLRPGAILENVPGLMVTQHSGEGKANQYFLRAFNLDHGTDIAIGVDGMPVNLPSHAAIFSPKAGFVLGPWGATTFFLNLGYGYHSNDARGVTRGGENPDQQPVTPLTRATGAEIGVVSEPVSHLRTRLDVFELKLRSELVFDGDAGITMPSGATTRTGVEIGNEYRLNGWLSANLDGAFTRGRFDHNSPPDDLGCGDAAPTHPCPQPIAIVGRYIPNSPTNVTEAGVQVHPASGWLGAIQARHFSESPLAEDNSARSPAYTTVDIQIAYRSPDHWRAALDVFNVANVKWNDIEYYYVSRLRNEPSPAAGYVVHPGVPRTLRIKLEYRF